MTPSILVIINAPLLHDLFSLSLLDLYHPLESSFSFSKHGSKLEYFVVCITLSCWRTFTSLPDRVPKILVYLQTWLTISQPFLSLTNMEQRGFPNIRIELQNAKRDPISPATRNSEHHFNNFLIQCSHSIPNCIFTGYHHDSQWYSRMKPSLPLPLFFFLFFRYLNDS